MVGYALFLACIFLSSFANDNAQRELARLAFWRYIYIYIYIVAECVECGNRVCHAHVYIYLLNNKPNNMYASAGARMHCNDARKGCLTFRKVDFELFMISCVLALQKNIMGRRAMWFSRYRFLVFLLLLLDLPRFRAFGCKVNKSRLTLKLYTKFFFLRRPPSE